jgi:hypothetical protein
MMAGIAQITRMVVMKSSPASGIVAAIPDTHWSTRSPVVNS